MARVHDLLIIQAPRTAIHWSLGLVFLACAADECWVVEQIMAILGLG